MTASTFWRARFSSWVAASAAGMLSTTTGVLEAVVLGELRDPVDERLVVRAVVARTGCGDAEHDLAVAVLVQGRQCVRAGPGGRGGRRGLGGRGLRRRPVRRCRGGGGRARLWCRCCCSCRCRTPRPRTPALRARRSPSSSFSCVSPSVGWCCGGVVDRVVLPVALHEPAVELDVALLLPGVAAAHARTGCPCPAGPWSWRPGPGGRTPGRRRRTWRRGGRTSGARGRSGAAGSRSRRRWCRPSWG